MPELNVRFGIVNSDSGEKAATWKVWTPPGKKDIYVAARELSGALKISLHESSNWHFAYDPQFFENRVPEAKRSERGRFIDKWPRPNPIAPGVTLALRIVTPWTALRLGKPFPEEIQSIEAPPSGMAREIGLFIVEPPTTVSGWPGKNKMNTLPVGNYEIEGGTGVWLTHWEIECPDFSGLSGKGHLFSGVNKSDIPPDLRAMVFGDHDDGSKVLYDLVGKYEVACA